MHATARALARDQPARTRAATIGLVLRREAAAALALVLGAAACSATLGLKSLGLDLGGDEPAAFALSVARGNTRGAYDLLCPAYRFGIPYDSFRNAVEANPFLSTATGVSVDRYRSGGGLALTKEGWIESTSGVAEAQFYLSKIDETWCLTGVVIGGTPALPVPGATRGEAETPPAGGSDAIGAGRRKQPARAALPAALDNDAYRAFGLARRETRHYAMSRNGGPSSAGTQRVELLGIEAEQARFRVVRGGALGVLGSLDLSLERDGLWLERSSQGELLERTLLMPARLDSGAKWRTRYVLGLPGGGQTRYDGSDVVVGRGRVTTPAGTFETIEVRSTATVEGEGQSGTIETRAWYADGIGSVRVESDARLAGEEPTRLTVELVDLGS